MLHRISWKCLLGFVLLTSGRVTAEVRLDLFVGFDGQVPQSAWFPVTLEVQNDGPTFTGTLEIVERGFRGGLRRSLTLELPTGTLKRVTIPDIRTEIFAGDWEAFLKDARGRTVASTFQSLKNRIPWGGLLVGSVSATSAGGAVFPPLIEGSGGQRHAGTARMLPHLLPDNPLALEGLQVLYLSTAQALELKSAQVDAITRWIERGGRLLVGVQQGNDLVALPWLRALLPALPERATTRQLGDVLHRYALEGWHDPSQATPFGMKPGAFDAIRGMPKTENFEEAEIPVWDLKLHRDARILLNAPGGPLVVARRHGWGDVQLLAFNPEREPFLGWSYRSWLWAALCGGKEWLPNFKGGYVSHTTDPMFGVQVDSRQIRKLPVGWLLLLLFAYLAVIGPLDRWWLKRIRREMLTWITFPCYVVFFSLLIYWIGSALRAGETEWNEVQVLDLIQPSTGPVVRARSFGSVYSPGNRVFHFGVDQGVAAFRFESGERGGFRNQDNASSQTGSVYSATTKVAVWTSQMFVQEGYFKTSPLLKVVVEDEGGGKLRARFDNQTQHEIPIAYLIHKESVFDLRKIPTGSSQAILQTDKADPSEKLGDRLQRQAMGINHAMNARQRTFEMGSSALEGFSANLTDALFCASFPTRLGENGIHNAYSRVGAMDGMDLSPYQEQRDCIFLAVLPGEALLPQFSRFDHQRGHVDTVFRAVIPVTQPQPH